MKKKHPIQENFVAIGIELLESPAWSAMKYHTRLIYIALAQEIRYYKDGTNNNGRIYLSTRTAARRVNTRQATAWDSFNEMEHYGFTVQTSPGMQGKKGRAARRRLTDIACDNADGTKAAPTKDYLDWDGVLFDPKAKRQKTRKPRKVIRPAYQGPVTPHVSGSDTPDVSGECGNGHLADTPDVSDLKSFPFNLDKAEPKPAVAAAGGDWPRNAQNLDERLDPEPIDDGLDIPMFLRRKENP